MKYPEDWTYIDILDWHDQIECRVCHKVMSRAYEVKDDICEDCYVEPE
jgi:hypothetical protein